jgi:hypothetical protein
MQPGVPSAELVWDAAGRATVTAGGAAPIHIGGPDGWSPAGLLAVAASACVMHRIAALAETEHLEMLGYVSTAGPPAGDPPRIEIAACVAVASEDDASRVRAILAAAVDDAAVGGALRNLVSVDARVSVIPETAGSLRRPRERKVPL